MTLLLVNIYVILALLIVLPLIAREWVARKNTKMVDESALSWTGAASRDSLVNHRAHVNRDPRFAQNPANTGFIFFYDCRANDLVIQGPLPRCRFFGISVYDRFSRPVSSMVTDEDVRASQATFVAFLTTRPSGARNEIDVSTHPRGTGIIRYSHMPHPENIGQYEPDLMVVDKNDRHNTRGATQ